MGYPVPLTAYPARPQKGYPVAQTAYPVHWVSPGIASAWHKWVTRRARKLSCRQVPRTNGLPGYEQLTRYNLPGILRSPNPSHKAQPWYTNHLPGVYWSRLSSAISRPSQGVQTTHPVRNHKYVTLCTPKQLTLSHQKAYPAPPKNPLTVYKFPGSPRPYSYNQLEPVTYSSNPCCPQLTPTNIRYLCRYVAILYANQLQLVSSIPTGIHP